jgi:hypothetical protein
MFLFWGMVLKGDQWEPNGSAEAACVAEKPRRGRREDKAVVQQRSVNNNIHLPFPSSAQAPLP